ncbi:MAG: hypothetical protein OHK005_09550 [Candidatus Methylacidiphilales bacterium]
MTARSGAVLVTCGPARVRLDEVRCLTNLSTGEIGFHLAHTLAAEGWRVECYRALGSTGPVPEGSRIHLTPFENSDNLAALLESRSRLEPPVAAIFHAAALNDYVLGSVEMPGGLGCGKAKWKSDAEIIQLTLVRAKKVLPRLRAWFPKAWIVGWKLEMDGTRTDVLAMAEKQIAEVGSDACVVNGRAYGEGFGLVQPGAPVREAPDKAAIAKLLASVLAERFRG